eukprot:1661050-Rhodomonas_salina.1
MEIQEMETTMRSKMDQPSEKKRRHQCAYRLIASSIVKSVVKIRSITRNVFCRLLPSSGQTWLSIACVMKLAKMSDATCRQRDLVSRMW